MLQAFFNGLSGLVSFSKGLNNVSDNVSNMNTPGFRGSDTFFRSVSSDQQGSAGGSEIAGTRVRTHAGETRQTGNSSDLAISGAGFFILRDGQGESFYTRAGQFQIDSNGVLVDSATRHRVAGIDAGGNLVDINIAGQQILPPKATTKINMVGNLPVSSTVTTHAINSIQVFDAAGVTQNLSMAFTKQSTTPNTTWKVDITQGGIVIGTGNITFSPSGTPTDTANKITFTLTSNGQSQEIVADFGGPGNMSMATYLGSDASLKATVVDGAAVAGLTGFSFDDKGMVKYTYSNGEKRDGNQIGLAFFSDETALISADKALFRAPTIMPPQLGRAGDGVFGHVLGGTIELSNVDLSQEFGDILIIQRGYQASSRVMTVANEMLEQLYNNTRGG